MKSRPRYCALALVSALAAGAALAQRGGGGLINAGPLVSPSYNFISYACIGSDSISHICTGDITTAAVTQITSGTCSDTTPEWSFDGSKIAFERKCGNDSDIYIANCRWKRGHSGYDDYSSFHSDLDAVRSDCILEHRISRLAAKSGFLH